MYPWQFSSLPLLPPLFYRPRFVSATAVALARHLFLVASLPSSLVRCVVPFDTFFFLLCSFPCTFCLGVVTLWFYSLLGFPVVRCKFSFLGSPFNWDSSSFLGCFSECNYPYLSGFSFAFASLYLRCFRSFSVVPFCGYFSF